jgi:3-hydroxybutyryl-CoA dehydrogenase
MEIKKVGVVGCGMMGRGIAEVIARAGYSVIISEVEKDLLDKALAAIDSSLIISVKNGKLSGDEKTATIERITGTTNLADFQSCDFVIEAAFENLDVKKKIFIELDKVCQPHAILATNTSVLSIMDIAAATTRQDKVLGMHFFNPVVMMQLIELVKTIVTSEETLNTSKTFAESLKKDVIIAKDAPGFIVNRLSTPLLLSAIRMLETGMATRDDIDKGIRLGMNHPMGPLRVADLVGLDTLYHIINALYEETKDPLFAPPILLKKMVAAGHFGRKVGKGFYDYMKH